MSRQQAALTAASEKVKRIDTSSPRHKPTQVIFENVSLEFESVKCTDFTSTITRESLRLTRGCSAVGSFISGRFGRLGAFGTDLYHRFALFLCWSSSCALL